MLVLLATDVVRSCRQRTASSRTRCSISSNDEMAPRRCRTFLHVVEAGGITAAAQRLNVSKSVISKRIGEFEDALGAELFRRSTRRVVPNGRGLDLYERMRALVQELDETIEQVSTRTGELRGRLRVTAPMTFGTRFAAGACRVRARPPGPRSPRQGARSRRERLQRGDPHRAPPDSSLIAREVSALSRRVVCCSSGYA